LAEASASRDRATGWLIGLGAGPATFVAVGAALAFGHPSVAFPLAALGCGVQVVRVCRARRDVDRIRRALQDPMDGS
jgi:hypothetical protein